MNKEKTTSPLAQEELQALDNLKKRKKALNDELAFIGLSKINLKSREKQAEAFHLESIELEKQLTSSLQKKYGNGTIDLESGTITTTG